MIDRTEAQEMLDKIRAAYQPEHEYVQIDPNDFKYLDLKYYDEVSENLAASGFRVLGDFEDVTLSQVWPRLRTFIRGLVSHDGTIMAGIYHMKPLGWLRLQVWLGMLKNVKALDLETEFSDGCFVITSTAPKELCLTNPPEIAREHYPPGTSMEEMLESHKQRVSQYLRANSHIACIPIRSLANMLASQNREMAIRSAHRNGIRGAILPEEMDRIAGQRRHHIGRDALAKMQELEEPDDEEVANH